MRILCLDIPAPGASLEKYAPHLNAEALHAWGLYKSGFIRDIYLIMREDERELFGLCTEDNIAMTPYSALASGRLSRKEGYTRRATEDDYARGKYDSTAEQDRSIIERVAELAERHLVSMTEISLAWLLTKVTSPVVGATKKAHVDGAVNAVNLQLSPEEIQFLEETYQPHVLTGVMAQNTPQTKDVKQVWMR